VVLVASYLVAIFAAMRLAIRTYCFPAHVAEMAVAHVENDNMIRARPGILLLGILALVASDRVILAQDLPALLTFYAAALVARDAAALGALPHTRDANVISTASAARQVRLAHVYVDHAIVFARGALIRMLFA
jgi:hypothetical protein